MSSSVRAYSELAPAPGGQGDQEERRTEHRSPEHRRSLSSLAARSWVRLGLALRAVGSGCDRLFLSQPSVVALENEAVLGREPFGHRLENAVALSRRDLRPILVACPGD